MTIGCLQALCEWVLSGEKGCSALPVPESDDGVDQHREGGRGSMARSFEKVASNHRQAGYGDTGSLQGSLMQKGNAALLNALLQQ